jgi:hypothetical protein
MGAILTMLLPALLPAFLDLAKGTVGAVSRKWIGLSVDDQIKLENAVVERLKVVASLDTAHGVPDQWVVNLRSSFRYIAALASISAGIALGAITVLTPEIAPEEKVWLMPLALDLIGIPFSFIFGERLYLGMKGTKQ